MALMRNISQFAVSLILLASQVNIPFIGNEAANAAPETASNGVYEVSLKTASAEVVVVTGAKKPDYDAEVLAPLRAAQAAEAARIAAARAKARAAARVKVVAAAPVAGSHADWMRAAGIAESDFGYVDYIISRESGWGVTKSNYGGSGAYGLGQALPASKMAKYGSDYLTNPVTQLRWANAYATGRYGTWANAYSHWLSRHSW